ncbi:ImmA/IrrE family metallo-endopeptidase [Pseudonocardia sichuanensis]
MCLLTTLREVLRHRGEVTIRQSDLEGLMGLAEFDTSTVSLDPELNAGEWRSTLAHELLHLLRGPVPRRLAATEEAAVQHETATLLFPAGQALGELDREWSDDDIQVLAARYGVDRDVIETAVHGPPTLPFPAISTIPAQREPGAARHRREP